MSTPVSTDRRSVRVVASILAALSVLLIVAPAALSAPANRSRCVDGPLARKAGGDPTQITAAGSIAIADPNKKHRLVFGTKRDADDLEIDFTSTTRLTPGTPYRATVTDFFRDDGVKFRRRDNQIMVQAQALDAQTVRVHLCFDPLHPQNVDPGLYSGTVTLRDPAFAEPVSANAEVTLKSNRPALAMLVPALALLVAILVRWLAAPNAGPLPQWLLTRARIVEVIFGIGGSAGAFAANWYSNDVWGVGGLRDFGTLFVACFAAATSSMLAKDAVKNASS